MIDRQTVDRILDAAEIVDVIQEFVPLKKRGVNYLGLCPFHNEKTPSFTVSPSKEIFNVRMREKRVCIQLIMT
jgi:DNA primase